MPRDATFPDAVTDAFADRFGRRPEVVVRAPGRVVLLGAHVDYSEGWVITAAIDRAVWLAAAPAGGTASCLHALDLGESATLDLARLPPPPAERPGGAADWVDVPAGVAWALREAGFEPPAIRAVFGGDLPLGAGVSSSAAVEMAFLLAWEALSGAPAGLDGAARARLGMRCENGYLGVQSGIMDQFSCLHGAAGRLVFLDCRSLEYEHLPMPEPARLLVADSLVRRRLVDSAFSDRRRECARAVELLAPHLPGVRTLRDVSVEDLERHAHRLPATLRRRARHAVEECARVHAGVDALCQGDPAAFGALMRRSHRSSRDLYQVSTPELDVLAESAWAAEGCHGARLLGGGFGGCVVALVETSAAGAVRRAMTRAFEQAFGRTPPIFACAAADGAARV